MALPSADSYHCLLQDESSAYQSALMCIEACVASLVLISADGMPKEVTSEEPILNIIAAIKSHLLLNVLAVHSARISHLHRTSDGKLLSTPASQCQPAVPVRGCKSNLQG